MTTRVNTKPAPYFNPERTELLFQSLRDRILVLDGAMGTAIHALDLKEKDFGGLEYEGCNENLVLTSPHHIQKIHEDYLQAGCDIVETDTFGGTPLVLGEFSLEEKAYEINFEAARLAREAAKKFSSPEQPRFVAGSMGPTTKAISVTGGISFEDLQNQFYEQAKALLEGGADYFLLETSQDTRNIKAGLLGIDRLLEEKNCRHPIAVSITIEPMGTMLAGQTTEAFLSSLSHRDFLYVGLNCGTGPEFMTDHIRSLSKLSPFPTAVVPNAGLPDDEGRFLETPQMVASVMQRFVKNGWVNLVGGCCGTHPEHIQDLIQITKNQPPRVPPQIHRSSLSGIEDLEITDEMRPVIVGERTNVIGSRKFKRLICENKFDEASEIARAQIKAGAQILDICLANPDRDELEDMRSFISLVVKKVKAPLMIDSTDEKVIEDALKYCQGKAIINSINLEDGEERFEKVIPIAQKYGAALIVGTIDDDPKQGMGVSRKRKLEIAQRAHELLTKKYGVAEEDIYWDPLVFPCATGDEQYVGSAIETIEGVREIKKTFPRTKTVLGISNVSFGLPPAGREVLNSVFLYHCVKAGLDLALVNSEKLERYASIPKEEIELADQLLFNQGKDPVTAFANHFRSRKEKPKMDRKSVPLLERLPTYILEGSKDGLIEDLNEALDSMSPIEIINGPLMKGMDEVGRLFNQNQLIVAEVLQSAEAMKAAVAHLEPFMEKTATTSRGKILLATVKGDVHDIGKNLVEIILNNNGFNVVNLGIKVPPEQLIQAIRKHKPDIVGLSGLLVKSAQQMVLTADDFTKAGVETPMLVGGAALSERFVDRKISKAYTGTVAYASDAMKGLELAKRIVEPEKFEELKKDLHSRRSEDSSTSGTSSPSKNTVKSNSRSKKVPFCENVPSPPDFERHVIKNTPIEQIWKYVNPLMMYGRHLGIRGSIARLLPQAGIDPKVRAEVETKDPKALQIWHTVEELKSEFKNTPVMSPAAVYQFFSAESRGNQILVHPNGNQNGSALPLISFEFPRQLKEDGLCIADYLNPAGHPQNNMARDCMAFFAVTVGRGIRELAEEFKNRGDYLKSHIIQVLALESAEGYAEFLHSQLRKMWGFPDSPEMTMMQRFQAKYRGKRYSFGYPACPRLDDQKGLFELLRPEEIGIQLTDGCMMDPEASVSAVVFHHPDAVYFSVGNQEGEFQGEKFDDNR